MEEYQNGKRTDLVVDFLKASSDPIHTSCTKRIMSVVIAQIPEARQSLQA